MCPYVKIQKNDDRDAEAIAEAATRSTMRFVALKTEAQLDLQVAPRPRSADGPRISLDEPDTRHSARTRGCGRAGPRKPLDTLGALSFDPTTAQWVGVRVRLFSNDMLEQWRALDARIAALTTGSPRWSAPIRRLAVETLCVHALDDALTPTSDTLLQRCQTLNCHKISLETWTKPTSLWWYLACPSAQPLANDITWGTETWLRLFWVTMDLLARRAALRKCRICWTVMRFAHRGKSLESTMPLVFTRNHPESPDRQQSASRSHAGKPRRLHQRHRRHVERDNLSGYTVLVSETAKGTATVIDCAGTGILIRSVINAQANLIVKYCSLDGGGAQSDPNFNMIKVWVPQLTVEYCEIKNGAAGIQSGGILTVKYNVLSGFAWFPESMPTRFLSRPATTRTITRILSSTPSMGEVTKRTGLPDWHRYRDRLLQRFGGNLYNSIVANNTVIANLPGSGSYLTGFMSTRQAPRRNGGPRQFLRR